MEGPYSFDDSKAIAAHSVCGECGANLINPWGGAYGVDGHIIRCVNDPDHPGIKPRGPITKKLMGVEYNVMTQTPVSTNQSLALPDTEDGMALRMREAVTIGLFPAGKNGAAPSQEQLLNLAKIALLYGLDPLMREIMPYQGQPYITIEGRRRIDARAGNHPSYRIRPMDKDTFAAYLEMGAVDQGDILVVGEFTDPRYGNTIEATGRVLKSETTGSEHLPTVKWRLEMAMKRCEARGRKMLYGPVALPGGAESQLRLVEEDDVVEGQVREIPDGAPPVQVDQATGEIVQSPPDRSTLSINTPSRPRPSNRPPRPPAASSDGKLKQLDQARFDAEGTEVYAPEDVLNHVAENYAGRTVRDLPDQEIDVLIEALLAGRVKSSITAPAAAE